MVALVFSIFASVLDFGFVPSVYAISTVQSIKTGTIYNNNLTITLDASPTEGNVLIATVGAYSAGLINITQTGVTWSKAASTAQYGHNAEIWYGIVGSGASTSLICYWTGDNYLGAGVVEYSGLNTADLLDLTATKLGNNEYPSTGQTTTTTQDDELWVGCTYINIDNPQTDPTNGFSLLVSLGLGTGKSLAYLKKIVSSTGLAWSNTTASGSNYWAGCIATFKASAEDTTITGSITDLTYPYNTTTKNEVAMFKANWTGTLSHYWLSTDFSGSYQNETAQSFSGTWSNQSKQLPNSIGTYHAKIYGNTTTGEENVTDPITITTTSYWTKYLETGDYTTVQNAVDEPTPGGNATVYMPIGNFTWTGSGTLLTLPSGVNLIGYNETGVSGHPDFTEYGASSIIHIDRAQNVGVTVILIDGENNDYLPTRVSGLRIENTPPDNSTVENDYGNTAIYVEQVYDFRIDHCTLTNWDSHNIYVDADDVDNSSATCYGVIDHCRIDVSYKDVEDSGWYWGYGIYTRGDYYSTRHEWSETDILDLYGDYGAHAGIATTYAEDNWLSRCRHDFDAIHGGFYVARYNKISKPAAKSPLGRVNNHGDSNNMAGKGYEAYNNTIYCDTANDFSYLTNYHYAHQLRGGSGLIYNETWIVNPKTGYNAYHYQVRLESETGTQSEQSVNKTWIWDNTRVNGSDLSVVNAWINENEEYFLRAPNNEDDGWSYLAYPYPHPLVSGESATYYYLNITSETGGSTTPSSGVHEYLDGTNVTVTAYPSPGYSFANWTPGDSTDNPTYVMMTANHTISPNFDEIDYVVTLTPTTTGLTQGETVSISVSVTKNDVTFTSYVTNVTRDGDLFKQNIVASNSTFTDQENTATSHTYSISALYDTDAGEAVSFSITPVTVYWNVPSVAQGGPPTYSQENETEADVPLVIPRGVSANNETLILTVGVAVIVLISITLVFVSSKEEKQPRGWRTY